MLIRDILRPVAILAAFGGVVWWNLPPAAFQSAEETARIEASVTYSGCNQVRAAGQAPLYAGQPGYRSTMDGDGDGIACEPIFREM